MVFNERCDFMKNYDLAVIGGGFAGAAIGLAVKNSLSVRGIDVKELQNILKQNGAFIGVEGSNNERI